MKKLRARIVNSSGKEFIFSIPDGFEIVYHGPVRKDDQYMSVFDLDQGKLVFKKLSFIDSGKCATNFRMVIRPITGGSDV